MTVFLSRIFIISAIHLQISLYIGSDFRVIISNFHFSFWLQNRRQMRLDSPPNRVGRHGQGQDQDQN